MSEGAKKDGVGRRRILKATGAGIVTATMAGCASQEPENDPSGNDGGGDDGDGGGSDGDGGGGDADTNTLVNIANQVIGTVDPAKHTDYTEVAAVLNFYDPLVYTDPDTNKPMDFIATEWNVEDGGTTWVFKVKEGVPTHDGNTISAEDVAYTMRRNLRLGTGYSSLWSGVLDPENITVRSDTEVAFETSSAYGPFIATLVQLFIVDSKAVKAKEKEGEYGERGDYGQAFLKENVAGSGPYTLENWQSGTEMVFDQFDDYWRGWDENSFDRARMEVVTEESTVKAMMDQGKADMTSQFLSTTAYNAMEGMDNVRVPSVPQLQLFHLPLHCQKAPTDDRNVRKAICHAFDYETAIEDIIKGGNQAVGPVPTEMPGHNDDLSPYEFDLDKARAAIEASDYTVEEINEIGLEQVHVANYPMERKMALLLSKNLKKIGIENVTINPQQWATITSRAANKEKTPHITHIFHTAKFPSPDGHTYLMYHPSSFGTYISMSWYTTDKITQILEEARSTTNLDERLAKYAEAQKHIVDGYPSVYVANPPYRVGLNENLGGWQYRGVLSFDLRWSTMHRDGDSRAK